MVASLDAEVTALARHLAEAGEGAASKVVDSSWWTEQMLEWAMSHPSFKTQLFRFVDVFPATVDDADVLAHLVEYFEGTDAPRLLDLGLGAAEHLPLGRAAAASLARRNIKRVAQQFIVGADPHAAVERLERLWRAGSASTVDLLGEKTLTEEEADRYAARVQELLAVLGERSSAWPAVERLEHDDLGPLARVNVSVKPTALASRLAPLTEGEGLDQAKRRLRPILYRALASGAFVHLDAEHYDVKDLTLRLFRELLDEPGLAGAEAGVVVQAYTRDSYRDLTELIAFSAERSRPITVRLVKGAYWDTETITARAAGWPVPVYTRKEETDANYERCTRLLHRHHGEVRAAFGTHNLRSISYAVQCARSLGIPDDGYEIQLLYGMAEPVHAAVRRLGLRLRVYAPVGDLVPGMAYLVRRLLENTANESFVRRRFVEGRALDELLQAPEVDLGADPVPPPRSSATDSSSPGGFRPEPVAEWRDPPARLHFARSVERLRQRGSAEVVPAVIGGRSVTTEATIASVDPAAPSTVLAVSACCGPTEADEAIDSALAAWPRWRATSAAERAGVVFRAAAWMRERRSELAALEVFEAGKPWPDADADVCEAIDFCEYYGRQMLRLDAGAPVDSPPGEANAMHYRGRGVGVVISPWNFPLAIPTGMVVAALVTGNAVVFKPAEQTPAVAAKLVEALLASGLPEGVLAFLPGMGDVGAHLVEHPAVSFVAFTGSLPVGLEIVASAAVHRPGQRHVKRVVAEMGGKNAVIVDADADLDQAVPIVITSAFGYSGQKCSACSRLIVVDRGAGGAEELIERLVGRAAGLRVGHPSEMGVDMGPLIDADAHERVRSYVDMAGAEGTVVLAGGDVPAGGYFVGPTIVTDVAPTSRLATEEIFGPVLAVMRVETFDQALEVANHTDYGLTAGVVSRSPSHIDRAVRELRAGNVYVNRPITGAVVGRQPFGGVGLSGVGSKAGGPDYLLQFLDPVALSENTMRQGFAPGDG
ncbi:MAG: proline dehydrogenase family protein [Actinobacteria bacterium]|nr:proline dehydrogenase family protein [Actinomycetota bacterium]